MKYTITTKDILKANRRASREEEIERHRKQIIFRTHMTKSKKTYSRKNFRASDLI